MNEGKPGPDKTVAAQGWSGPAFTGPPPDSFTGYKVIREVHRGGQAVVYQAVHKSTRRKVAIKVMKEGPFAGPVDKARFDREVQILGQLNHPHIVAIHDTGVAAGSHYFVMDYISGQPLDVYMQSGDRSIVETLKLFVKICEAINAAHLRGVIHRDLKPGNIVIDAEGEPHILDFGLAKTATSDAEALVMTETGQFMGSLPWASPEQAEAMPSKIDIRTDVYSLGVILYQMLTGQFPYEVVGNMRDVLNRIMTAQPRRPSTTRKQINDEVETIVLKCLSKERERRYQTAGELGRDIRHYLNGEPIEAKRDSFLYMLRKQLLRYRVPAAISGAFVILVTVGFVTTFTFWRRAERAKSDAEQQRDRAVLAERKAFASKAEEARQRQEAQEAIRALRKAQQENYYDVLALADARIADSLFGQAEALLFNTPKELRGWECGWLMQLCHPELVTLKGHVLPLSIGLQGGFLRGRIIREELQTGRIWEPESGLEILPVEGRASLNSVAFSMDGKLVVGVAPLAVGPGILTVWRADTGREVSILEDASGSACVTFSPNGKRVLAGSRDGTAGIWDAEVGRKILTLDGHSDAVNSVAFSPDGKRVLTGSYDTTAKLWDAETGEQISILNNQSGYVGCVAFAPDGKRVLTADSHGIAKIWGAETGQEVLRLSTLPDAVTAVAFSPGGERVLAGSRDGTAKLWDAETGREILVLKGHSRVVWSVAFSRDGKRIVTSSPDGTAKIWDGEGERGSTTLRGLSGRVRSVGFSPEGKRVVAGSDDQTAKVWDAETFREMLTLRGHSGDVTSVAFSPDGKRIVTGSRDQTAKVWDAEAGQEMLTLRAHSGDVTSVAFSPDGKRVVTGSRDQTAKVWDAEAGKEILILTGHSEGVTSVTFSPDGKRVVTGSWDRMAKVWDVGESRSPGDGWMVLRTNESRLTLEGHFNAVRAVAFSPEGRRVLTGSEDESAKIWDSETGHEVLTLKGHSGQVISVAFSPNGKRALTGSEDESAKIWDSETGHEVLTLKGHSGPVVCVAFSPNGQRLVTGSGDGTVRIWEAFDWNVSLGELERQKRERYSRWLRRQKGGPQPTPPVPKLARGGNVLAFDDFDGKLSLDWNILHEDPSHYSLDKIPKTLTITTQEGAFTRDKNDYENVFLINCPPEAGTDLEVTVCISSFKPVDGWNQAGLIFWNDEDDYLKCDYEASTTRVRLFTVGREIGGRFGAFQSRAPVDLERVWLRARKQENHYNFFFSTDGTTWHLQRTLEWGDGSVKRIGLFAMNDSPSAAPEVDASFDSFEVRALPLAP